MTTVKKNRLMRTVQFRAFDELPKEVQDTLNYSNTGFSARDICYLHSLYVNKIKSTEEIVDMIKAKDTFITLLGPFGRKMV